MCVVSLKALGQALFAPTQVSIVCQERSVMLLVYAVSSVQSYVKDRKTDRQRQTDTDRKTDRGRERLFHPMIGSYDRKKEITQ